MRSIKEAFECTAPLYFYPHDSGYTLDESGELVKSFYVVPVNRVWHDIYCARRTVIMFRLTVSGFTVTAVKSGFLIFLSTMTA